jgi:hypothetical protein
LANAHLANAHLANAHLTNAHLVNTFGQETFCLIHLTDAQYGETCRLINNDFVDQTLYRINGIRPNVARPKDVEHSKPDLHN